VLGVITATLFLGDINTGPAPPGLGSPESQRVNYGHEPRETLNREWLFWRGSPADVMTDPSSGRLLRNDYDQKVLIVKISLVVSPKGLGTKTNRLAVNRQSLGNSDSEIGYRDSSETHRKWNVSRWNPSTRE
jgi:hypothetical protein